MMVGSPSTNDNFFEKLGVWRVVKARSSFIPENKQKIKTWAKNTGTKLQTALLSAKVLEWGWEVAKVDVAGPLGATRFVS